MDIAIFNSGYNYPDMNGVDLSRYTGWPSQQPHPSNMGRGGMNNMDHNSPQVNSELNNNAYTVVCCFNGCKRFYLNNEAVKTLHCGLW
uniref:Uncharacterized protein n=1 Tax=Ciona intestinalis TaxID=7719 RepID=H2XWH3_CIOIN